MSMTNSGAFLLGPAIAGVLIMYFGTELCMMINAVTFLVCAFFIFLLPNVEEGQHRNRERVGWQLLINDWRTVTTYVMKAKFL